MTPRSIRRAAERKAKKKALKAAQHLAPASLYSTTFVENPSIENFANFENFETPNAPDLIPESAPPTTESKLAIPSAAATNANVTVFTSPLTGQTTLFHSTDAAPFQLLLEDHQNIYRPVGLLESTLVQTIAECAWRARRALSLEMSIFAKGRIEFAEQFAEHNPDLRESLVGCHTFLIYEKQIRSLQLQEARLVRRSDKATAELRTLQKERLERATAEAAIREKSTAQTQPKTVPSAQNGSVFSNREITPNHMAAASTTRNVETHEEAA